MEDRVYISVIIVSFNTKEILDDCIRSLLINLKDINFEILIVDNGSSDGSKEFLKTLTKKNKKIRCFFMDKNLGFGSANNYAMERSKGEYLLLLNSDIYIKNDVIQKVAKWMDANKLYGAASANLYNKDGSIQGTGGYFPTLLRVFSWMTIQDIPFVDNLIKPFHPLKPNSPLSGESFYAWERDLDWLTGAFLMIRRNAYEDTGFFDPVFFMYTEEVEYCLRLKKKGWGVRYLPYDGIIHLGGASAGTKISIISEFEGVKKLYKKHYPSWQYTILKLILKIGCLWRIPVYGLIKGKEAAKIYVKAFAEI
jgi:hypothetical protein